MMLSNLELPCSQLRAAYHPTVILQQGSPTFLELRATSWYRFMRRATSFMLSLIIKNIHQCEDTDHVYVIFRTSPRATHMVRAGDLVPVGTTLVTLSYSDTLTLKPLFSVHVFSGMSGKIRSMTLKSN